MEFWDSKHHHRQTNLLIRQMHELYASSGIVCITILINDGDGVVSGHQGRCVCTVPDLEQYLATTSCSYKSAAYFSLSNSKVPLQSLFIMLLAGFQKTQALHHIIQLDKA